MYPFKAFLIGRNSEEKQDHTQWVIFVFPDFMVVQLPVNNIEHLARKALFAKASR